MVYPYGETHPLTLRKNVGLIYYYQNQKFEDRFTDAVVENYLKSLREPELLLVASISGRTDIVKRLVKTCDVNVKNHQGLTSLMLSCMKGHHEVAKILIENGADTTVSVNGVNALHIANYYGHNSIIDMITDSHGRVPHV